MSIKALQDYTYYSRYARYNKEEKRRETWQEAVDRVKEMHLRKYPKVAEHIEWAFDLVKTKRILGSQRALQFGGKPIEKKHARLYNCCSSYCDRIRFFQECLWLLLCGCGAGFSVQKHHIDKLPDFFTNLDKRTEKIYAIPDSIEGWSDALGILLATYMPHPEFPEWEGYKVIFEYSQIRKAGSILSSGAGRAPGPEPLKAALERIRELLDKCSGKQKRLRPIDAYDVVMHSSDAVLSGGVRRSATIAIFSPDDEEMITAKTGNWRLENPQRGRSNNSALLIRDKTQKSAFLNLIKSVREFGEPGFFWADDTEALFNPCGEISFVARDEEGNSGWNFCNLTEINGKKIKCEEDFALAARGAAIIGTLQAGYTDFDYLGPVTKRIVEKEALLGVSITGMMDNPDIIFDPQLQRKMAKLVVKTNEWFAALIGINPAARSTCVKPAGTSSCLLGSASGIHPHHAKRYFRRVQANRMEPILQFFKSNNPIAVEKSVWSANGTDDIITFAVEVEGKTKNDLSALQLLEIVRITQQNWVAYGKTKERCVKEWLSHNVSNTIHVRTNEWEDVANYIYDNRKSFAGITLLPESGDLDYPQAPFVNVLTPREILQRYGDGSILASGLVVDGFHAFNDLWVACDAVLGMGAEIIEPVQPNGNSSLEDHRKWKEEHDKWELKRDWVRRVKQFASRYCDEDTRKCTYLMKHVHCWKQWLDLQRERVDVDYTSFHESEDVTRPGDFVACSGGACEVAL